MHDPLNRPSINPVHAPGGLEGLYLVVDGLLALHRAKLDLLVALVLDAQMTHAYGCQNSNPIVCLQARGNTIGFCTGILLFHDSKQAFLPWQPEKLTNEWAERRHPRLSRVHSYAVYHLF